MGLAEDLLGLTGAVVAKVIRTAIGSARFILLGGMECLVEKFVP